MKPYSTKIVDFWQYVPQSKKKKKKKPLEEEASYGLTHHAETEKIFIKLIHKQFFPIKHTRKIFNRNTVKNHLQWQRKHDPNNNKTTTVK